MKRACIIITDARFVDGVTLWTDDDPDENPNAVAEMFYLTTSEQLLADLAWVLAAAERAVEVARDQGNDTAAALLGGCVARVRAAIGEPEIPPRDG